MSFQAQEKIVTAHAFSIIRHAYQGLPAVSNGDGNFLGPRIDAVVDEFSDDGSRPFNHLSRGNLSCDLLRKDSDHAHDGLMILRSSFATLNS